MKTSSEVSGKMCYVYGIGYSLTNITGESLNETTFNHQVGSIPRRVLEVFSASDRTEGIEEEAVLLFTVQE